MVWYKHNARDLPWRQTKNPYKIWISEVMLQQTQVDTVIPYFNRWFKRFPTIRSLAKADLNEVMKHWAGLGYYRRARMLHKAAKYLFHHCSGRIPETTHELLKLPGIGRYTAGAIASIAFGRRSPILDGNVIRVLTRLFAISSEIEKPRTLLHLWNISESLVPERNPGDFNQALMELGATICLPENPLCKRCPVSRNCEAHMKSKETYYPVKKAQPISERLRTAALICRDNGKILVQKQPDEARWGGLWMFPHWRNRKSMLAEIRHFARVPTKPSLIFKCVMTVHHSFTKYRIALEVFEPENQREWSDIVRHLKLPNSKWIKTSHLRNIPLPSPHQKIADKILKSNG